MTIEKKPLRLKIWDGRTPSTMPGDAEIKQKIPCPSCGRIRSFTQAEIEHLDKQPTGRICGNCLYELQLSIRKMAGKTYTHDAIHAAAGSDLNQRNEERNLFDSEGSTRNRKDDM